MKLKRISITGFRGAPGTLDLNLGGKSLCLLAENGRGKSTIVDALEYWSHGRLANFEREGYRLDAAINLAGPGHAEITCERTGQETLTRELSGNRASALRSSSLPQGNTKGKTEGVAQLPILRHRTMADFMANSPGEKKKALLDLLGLTNLTSFREALVTATNNARKRRDNAEHRVQEERRALAHECGGQSAVGLAESLRKQAGLYSELLTEDAVLALKIDRMPSLQWTIDRAQLVEDLVHAHSELSNTPIRDWNAIAEDKQAVAAAVVNALIVAGKKALTLWGEPSCPLCLAPVDRDSLHRDWERRAAALAELDARLTGAASALAGYRSNLLVYAGKIKSVLHAPWTQDIPQRARLAAAEDAARRLAQELSVAVSEHRLVVDLDLLDLSDVLASLQELALAEEESPEIAALVRLERIRVVLRRYRDAVEKSDATQKVCEAIDAFRLHAEKVIRVAVEEATAELAAIVGNFYARLVRSPFYSDVRLKYSEARNGGVEFALRFAERHEVSPPQRVVSESQLNALGLAFFLARLKHTENEIQWRTLVLDDVVNSFDADHRMGLARLLVEEFGEWQVLFFTHDNMFATLSERFFSGWRFWQVVAWSPSGGPVLSEGDPLKRLEERLRQGETAMDLGGLARFALERGLSRPLERLGFAIRFDRRGLHAAVEYRDALEQGLKARGSHLKDAPVLMRMKGESYLVNVGAHDRQADPNLSTADLLQMVADLRDLNSVFTCEDCDQPAWSARKGFDGFQCRCSKLAI